MRSTTSEIQTSNLDPSKLSGYDPDMDCVCYISDMIFTSRIRHAAKDVGVALDCVSSPSATTSALEKHAPPLLIVDMDASGDPVEAIRAAKNYPNPPRILAFYSHVRTDLAESARKAGADDVWPRSRFVNELPTLLASTVV